MPVNPMMVAQAEGFIRKHFELDIDRGDEIAEQALEWFAIIETALSEYRTTIRDLENRINNARMIL